MNGEHWNLGEFVKYILEGDDERFKITLEGPNKYRNLIATKLNEIQITEDDLRTYVAPDQ